MAHKGKNAPAAYVGVRHEIELLRALNLAAASLQRSSLSEEAVFQAVREHIAALGLRGGLMLRDESDQRLVVRALSLQSAVLERLEQLTALHVEGFQFAIDQVSVYQEAVRQGKTIFVPDSSYVTRELIPRPARRFVRPILNVLGTVPAIFAPIYIGGRVQGVLNVAGERLVEGDTPFIEAFANHIAIALENARLFARLGLSDEILQRVNSLVLVADQNGDLVYISPSAQTILGYQVDELLGDKWWQLTFADEAEAAKQKATVAAYARGEAPLPDVPYERPVRHKNGEWRWIAWHDARGPANQLVGIGHDLTERVQSERVQAALYQIASVASSDISLDSLYREIHKIIGTLMPAGNFFIALYDPQTNVITTPYFVDEFDPQPATLPPWGKSLTNYVIRTGEPLLLNEAEHQALIRQGEVEMLGTPSPIWLGVPLQVSGQTIGAVVVQHYRDANAYSAREKQVLTFVSDQIAIAMQRKQAEQALRQAEAELRLVFNSAPNYFWSAAVDPAGQLTYRYYSPVVERITGRPPAFYMVGRERWLSTIHPEDRPELEKAASLAMSGTEEEIAREYRIILPDGQTVRWLHDHVNARRSDDDSVYLYGVVSDITERRQVEESLKTRERQQAVVAELGQRALIEGNLTSLMEQAVAAVADTLRVEYCKVLELLPGNKALRLRAGVGWRPGLVGQAVVDAGLSSQAGYTLHIGGPVIVEDLPQESRFSGPPLLREHNVRGGLSVIIHGQERPFGVLGAHSTRPLSFSRDDVHFLQSVANVLATAIERQRTEEALRHAQKVESLGLLAGGVAHDFNNLLVAMLGQATLALSQLPPGIPAWASVEKVVMAAERAADLTRQLLAYSGRGQFQTRLIDLNTFIQRHLPLLEVAVPKNVQLQADLAPAMPLIEADVGQIQQVVMNLVLNAAEAIGERPGHVCLRTAVRLNGSTPASIAEISNGAEPVPERIAQVIVAPAAPGRHVTLEVRDDGSGMDADTLSRIFDPFFTTKFTGRGLGLAAVLGVVRGHKGGLEVDTQVGRGTTFRIVLPASLTEASPDEAGPVPEAREIAVPDHSRPLILVIDDEEPVREAVTDILAMEEVDVLSAANGPQGLELFRQRQTDIQLVLLDLSMPGMSGEETFVELRRIDPQVRVLLSSGYSQMEARRRFSSQEPAGFLQKPYSADSLVTAVRRHLR
ncbi:MAG: GAF domain-containing protein [Chloroflexota bacterium]